MPLGFACAGHAPRPPTAPPERAAPPPEVARTVEAVVGSWVGSMTATVPGHAAETFAWTIHCVPIALGSGASCAMRGKPSIGPIEQSCLFAYDPGGKAVHFMCVTSIGEVHDHRGQWSGAEIEFEPLEATLNGEPIVESVSWRFPAPARLETTSAIALRGGAAMRFEFAGARQ